MECYKRNFLILASISIKYAIKIRSKIFEEFSLFYCTNFSLYLKTLHDKPAKLAYVLAPRVGRIF